MKITRFEINLFGTWTYMLWNPQTRHAIVVDPGMFNETGRQQVQEFIVKNQLEPVDLLLTHGHIDHIASANWLAKQYGLKVKGSTADELLETHLAEQIAMFHLKGLSADPVKIDQDLKQGDVVKLDDEDIQVLATPGHSPGGLTYYIPSHKSALVGDSIFKGSIGRTDLPGGDVSALLQSIKQRILTLPLDTQLLPGHGPITTVAQELATNPFVR